jgi:UDP-3-O-[3-hydroxymyristoyl] glucosamine N-acyltransferase
LARRASWYRTVSALRISELSDVRTASSVGPSVVVAELLRYLRGRAGVSVRVPDGVNPEELAVHNVRGDVEARSGDISWISAGVAERSPERIGTSGASVLILPASAAASAPDGAVCVFTDQPKRVFADLVERFFGELTETKWPEGEAHVAADAVIGARVSLAPGVVIGANTVLHDDVVIGPNTCVANATIHARVRIGCNCTIGLPGFGYAQEADRSYRRFPHVGRVRIEEDVEIGSNTCVDRGALGETIIRRGVKIDNLVHVAHNCIVGENALLIANTMLGGSTVIGANAWVAPSVSILNQLTIGDGATLGMGAVVIRDVPPATTVVGNPAKALAPRA